MKEAKLYIIATPLGHRADITLRALDTFKELGHFFAEDSREFRKLLDLCGIGATGKEIYSYANHNLKDATERGLNLLRQGHSLGLVCDRGTPALSDPGFLMARVAREEGFGVIPVPGPSSLTTILSVAGIPADRFLFLGFLPLPAKPRDKLLDLVERGGLPACFFESPKRIKKTLRELARRFPDGSAFLGREMTKFYEEYRWISLGESDESWNLVEKGEYAVVLNPGAKQRLPAAEPWTAEVELRLDTDKNWAKSVSDRHGIAASEVYNALQAKKRSLAAGKERP